MRNSRIYKESFVELAAALGAPLFHAVAMLPPDAPRPRLEAALREWAARVDRFYLGRRWQQRPERRMDGLAFFESRPGPHAHLIVRPPIGAAPFHFLMHAALLFRPEAARELRWFYPAPVTNRGKMLVKRIGNAPGDRARVAGYATKEMEYRPEAIAGWKFLRDLSGH